MPMAIMFSYSLLVKSGIAILLFSQVAVGIDDGLGIFPMEDDMIKAAAGLNFQSKRGDSTLRVYPRLRFNCVGAIFSITVVGQCLDSNNLGLELHLWEPVLSSLTPEDPLDDEDDNAESCILQHSRILNYTLTNKTNVIQLNITGGASFRVGTVLGIKHSESLTLLYGSSDNGQSSYIASEAQTCIQGNDGNNGDLDYPLISVQLVCKTRCEGPCTSGFLPLSNQLFSPDETTIFPALHFTSSGSVLSWQFAAIERPGSSSSMPHIQIWRPCQMHGTLPTDTDTIPCYNLAHSTSRQNVTPQMDEGNVYTYQLDSEMQVRVGDVVGVQQAQDSRLLLALRGEISSSFVTGFNSNVTSSNTHEMMRPLPLLRPASSVESSSTAAPTYMSSTTSVSDAATATTVPTAPPDVTSSVSPGNTDMGTDTGSQSSVGAGVGVGVGAAVVLLVVVGVLGVCLFCVWRRRHPSKVVISTCNVAYGVTNMKMSGNVAYGATKSVSFQGEDTYDYVSTTDGNDIITTSPNEACAATDNVPVSSNQAYGMVHH